MPRDQSIVRCPWCKDFFKPLAELIVLHEEEIHRLKMNRPGAWILSNPPLQWIIRAGLIIPWVLGHFWLSVGLLCCWEAWLFRLKMNQDSGRIKELSRARLELEALYRKEQ